MVVGLAAFAQEANVTAEWKRMRERLLVDETYIDEVRGGQLPVSEGYIVAMEPAVRPHTLLIGIETPLVAELKLRLLRDGAPARLTATPARKTKIHFRSAQIESFTRHPFVLTATTEDSGIDYDEARGTP